jgi:predicted dehydrogenase
METAMINVGVIGYGYWGPNLVRNFMDLPQTRLAAVSDVRADRLALAARRYPGVAVMADYRELVDDPKIDAVAVATPVHTHFELGRRVLEAGKHLLVEKPLAASAAQTEALIEAAAQRGRVLMVDHTFAYTGAVRKIRELIDSRAIGDVYYFDSVRISLGLFQHDVNVIWDLAVHDLSILDYVLRERPCAVSAVGRNHVPDQPENIAYVTLFFDSSLLAHVHVNWLAPVKVRRALIGGSQKMIVYDDLEPSEKVKVYDTGITVNGDLRRADSEQVYQLLIGYRTGDMWAPQLDRTEALRTELAHFADCIEHGQAPLTDGHAGLRVVRLLEAAAQSARQQGRVVELDQNGAAR